MGALEGEDALVARGYDKEKEGGTGMDKNKEKGNVKGRRRGGSKGDIKCRQSLGREVKGLGKTRRRK